MSRNTAGRITAALIAAHLGVWAGFFKAWDETNSTALMLLFGIPALIFASIAVFGGTR